MHRLLAVSTIAVWMFITAVSYIAVVNGFNNRGVDVDNRGFICIGY